MTDFKVKLRAEVKLAVQDVLEKDFPFQSCINCDHWSNNNDNGDPNETCSWFHARPPAKIIVHGCEKWMNKGEIPF